MLSINRKQLARIFWPRYSHTLDIVNRNAQVWATVRDYERRGVQEFSRREDMYAALNQNLGNIAITYLEFGVWQGDSLRRWAGLNAHPGSRFFGFDSFEGLPEDWVHGGGKMMKKGEFALGGKAPSIPDPRVTLVSGWFQHTLRGFLANAPLVHPIVVHNDSDLHSSTQYTLATLDPFLQSGDIIIFDEYSSPANEYLAWEEYKRAFMRDSACIAMSHDWRQAAFVLR